MVVAPVGAASVSERFRNHTESGGMELGERGTTASSCFVYMAEIYSVMWRNATIPSMAVPDLR